MQFTLNDNNFPGHSVTTKIFIIMYVCLLPLG